jgi:hypothetical protein
MERIFPDFAGDPELIKLTEDLPGVYLSFFISYAKENWNDQFFQARLIQFLENLHKSEDETTKTIFLDFALDFQLHFEEHKISIDSFLQKLSIKAKSEFVDAVYFWKIAMKNYGQDGGQHWVL